MNKNKPAGGIAESLVDMLGRKDGMTRLKARKALVALGKPAVPSLVQSLLRSNSDQVRWEAAKALGAIGDARAIPSLVKALEDGDEDVGWLAAEGLRKFKKAAWPVLFRALIKGGRNSGSLRRGAHHVLLNRRGNGFDYLLTTLKTALESSLASESTPVAAYNILTRMRGHR
jgi:hypothetical protein